MRDGFLQASPQAPAKDTSCSECLHHGQTRREGPFSLRASSHLGVRATPSGTAGLHHEGTLNSKTNQRITIAEKQRLSIKYLANQKTPSCLQSVFLFDKLGSLGSRKNKDFCPQASIIDFKKKMYFGTCTRECDVI